MKLFTLKSHSSTRWESRIDSVKALRFQISEVRDALEEIASSKNFDADTRFEATNLITQIEKYEFLLMLAIWYDILSHVNIVSQATQAN